LIVATFFPHLLDVVQRRKLFVRNRLDNEMPLVRFAPQPCGLQAAIWKSELGRRLKSQRRVAVDPVERRMFGAARHLNSCNTRARADTTPDEAIAKRLAGIAPQYRAEDWKQ
jgi:hypothetical protein